MIKRGIRVVEKFYGELYEEGERLNELFFLIEGKVTFFKKDEEGRRVQLPAPERGSFLGLQALHAQHLSSHSAKVCKTAKLLVIPLVQLSDFMTRWPAMKQQITRQLIDQIDQLDV